MKKFILILISILAINFNTLAQMGIGRIPHTGSILDLTNSDNKYILFPKASPEPSFGSLSSTGAIIYYQGKFYLKAPVEIKILTPWQWDGSPAGYISSSILNPVAIGINPSVFPYRLQIADAAGSGVRLSGLSKSSILIGDSASDHLAVDNNEIIAKTNASTAGILKLQKEGGIVVIGMSNSANTNTTLEANGSIDAANKGKIKENGNDLLPSGIIIMYSGLAIPDGWALCDGGSFTTPTGVVMTTPDLRQRFIVGTGAVYAIADIGGIISSAHTHNFDLPPYTPAVATEGTHSHGGTTGGPSSNYGTSNVAGFNYPNSGHTHSFASTSGGTHFHTIDVPPSTSGLASIPENRPPYYALYFIMKK